MPPKVGGENNCTHAAAAPSPRRSAGFRLLLLQKNKLWWQRSHVSTHQLSSYVEVEVVSLSKHSLTGTEVWVVLGAKLELGRQMWMLSTSRLNCSRGLPAAVAAFVRRFQSLPHNENVAVMLPNFPSQVG